MGKWTKIVIILICLTGCKSILKTAYGIKKPKLEDDISIRKYLLKNHIDTSNVYVFKNLKAFTTASQMKILSVPDALFFNKIGFMVPYKESTVSCNANVDKFISDLAVFSALQYDETKKESDLLDLIVGNTQVENADVNVFITWTVYAGKLNKDKAFEWIKLLQSAKVKGIKVNYFLLNCDYQKNWNLTGQQQIFLGIKQ
ncbi:MAG TPA: hypothetical protein VK623_10190 [Flavobacterium sp.]|nr:hypothetical protein [Flavobacterium sp.]